MTLAQSFSLHALIVLFSVCVEAKATSDTVSLNMCYLI